MPKAGRARRADLLGVTADLHEEMPAWIEALAKRQKLSLAELQSPSTWGASKRWPFATVWQAAEYVIGMDPVAFAEVHFVVRNAIGEPPLRLWPYQKATLRYGGDLILCCAPETGKSMCAGIWACHRFLYCAGDVLVAGAFGAHARAIHKELLFQLERNPYLSDLIDWNHCITQPYPEIHLRASGRVMHFRPVGNDGTAIRSLRVSTIVVDEAVKIRGSQAREAWANIDSRLLPGGRKWFLSTPDGQRLAPFIDRCLKTPEVEPIDLPAQPAAGIRRVVWSKRLQPAPFFTPARLRQWIEDYGGENSPEFVRNVDGQIGQPSRAVFELELIERLAVYVPSYQRLRIEQKGSAVELQRWRLRPGGNVLAGLDDEEADGMVVEALDRQRLTDSPIVRAEASQVDRIEAWLDLLEPMLPSFPGQRLVAGIDAGKLVDPFEVLIGRVSQDSVEWVLRLQLLRLDYRAQDALVRALDLLLPLTHGWGLDGTSNPPISEYLDAVYTVRGKRHKPSIGKYLMNLKVDRVTAKGKPLKVAGDKEGRDAERWTYKAQGVSLLENAARANQRRLPYDPEIVRELAAYEEFPGRQYSRKNDHIVAAAIVMELRLCDVGVAHWSSAPGPVIPPSSRLAQFARPQVNAGLDGRPPATRRSLAHLARGKRGSKTGGLQ